MFPVSLFCLETQIDLGEGVRTLLRFAQNYPRTGLFVILSYRVTAACSVGAMQREKKVTLTHFEQLH